MTYEDELPQDITDQEYTLWFERSTVDGVRVGPSIEFVRSLVAISSKGNHMNESDAAYEIIRCAIHFADPQRDHEQDDYYNATFLEACKIVKMPVFELKINTTSRGRSHQLVLHYDSGSFTMNNLRYPHATYNWLEDHFYNVFDDRVAP